LNKISSQELAASLVDQLRARQIPVLGTITHNDEIVKTCLAGDALDSATARKEMKSVLEALLAGGPRGA